MLQALLAERFGLALRREQKTMQVYTLEVAKGGPKMQEAPDGDTGEPGCTRSFAQTPGATLAAAWSPDEFVRYPGADSGARSGLLPGRQRRAAKV
jgi:uncharacterized protein (TIGR03435 family)